MFETLLHCVLFETNNVSTAHNQTLVLILYSMLWSVFMTYKYVFSKWRSIMPVEFNQYDITMGTHYDITMCNDVASMPIVKSQWVMMLLGTFIVMSQ